MTTPAPAYEVGNRLGLGLHLPQDADVSHFSLRSDSSTPETHYPAVVNIGSATATSTAATTPPPQIMAQRSRFQATVDDDDSDIESIICSAYKRAADNPPAPRASTYRPRDEATSTPPLSSPPTYTTYSKTPFANKQSPAVSSAYPHAHKVAMLTPPSSAESSPKQRPTVHFSTRPPVVLHHKSNTSASDTDARTPRYGPSPKAQSSPCKPAANRQQLYSEHNEPIARLDTILHDLATYMVREYEPRYSLVIPPAKMLALYKRYKLDKELFPFQGLFDYQSRHCLRNLELLYQDLSCEYHLVQDHHHSGRPYIPALTPIGLQTWLSAFIQASPDHEFHRLQKIIIDIPLGANPMHTERLFPAHKNDRIQRDIVCAIEDWNKRMGSTSEPPSPSWTNVLYEAFRGNSQPNSSLRDKSYNMDDYKRYHGRNSVTEDVTISPANSARRNHRNTSPSTYQEPEYSTQRGRYHDSEPRYIPSPSSEPPKRRYSEPSSERAKYSGHTSRHRDKSPKAQRAASIDGAGREKRQHFPRYSSASSHTREYEELQGRKKSPESRHRALDESPARVDSYRFFQGRERGPTYEEFIREKMRG